MTEDQHADMTESAGDPGTPGVPGDPAAAMRLLRARLRRIRRRARRALVGRAAALIVAAGLAGLLTAGGIDFVLRLPAALRWIVLLGWLAVLVVGVRRLLLPAARFKPSLPTLALRLEARAPGAPVRGLLASALELERARAGQPISDDPVARALRVSVAERAAEAADRSAVDAGVINIGPLVRASLVLAASLLVTGAIAGLAPGLARTGVARVLTPWTDARWPSRTDIELASSPDVHPADVALPIRGALARPADAEGTRVTAVYRVTGPGLDGRERRVNLAAQRTNVVGESGEDLGRLFEGLIEPASLIPVGAAEDEARAAEYTLTYRLETEDDQTGPVRVKIVEPPELRSVTASVSPPVYAAGIAADAGFRAGFDLSLGDGTDERSVLGPVLAGSRVELELGFNTPPDPEMERPAFLEPVLAVDPSAVVTRSEAGVRVSFTALSPVRMPVSVEDRYGLVTRSSPVFAIDVVDDAPASAAVTEPVRDEAVLATAVVPLTGEGRDDIGLRWVELRRQVARRDAGSVGGGAEPVGEAEPMLRVDATGRSATLSATLDLSTLGVQAGDEVLVTAAAADARPVIGDGSSVTVSQVRRLTIISESELIEQMRAQLAAVRRAAIRLDEEQAALERSPLDAGEPIDESLTGEQRAAEQQARMEESAARREAQAALSERIAVQRSAVEMLSDRQARNGLSDESLSGLLEDAESLLGEAGEASTRAAEQLAERASAEAGDEAREAEQRVAAEQGEVRDELGRLARLLDRGEDGWLARRSLERLLEDQKRLAEQTAEIEARTLGRGLEDLDEAERSELDRIAERQRELAERARQAIDELAERARDLREADASQAAAMDRASRGARQAGVPQKLEEAADQAQQNQTSSAQENQQEAVEALEEALEELDNADRNRDRELQRRAADLVRAIEQLILAQESALTALEDARRAAESVSGLAPAMLSLRDNTLAVTESLAGGFDELEGAGALLVEAAEAQAGAVSALRDEQDKRAQESEEASLQLLKDAKASAEEAQEDSEQRETDRRRRELRAAYREQLERQVAVRSDTEPFAGRQLARRERIEARSVGQAEQSIGEALRTIMEEHEELTDAPAFQLAHERLDVTTGAAADDLTRGRVTLLTGARQDEAVELLQGLVEALAEQQKGPDDEFSEGGGGSGGGGAGGQPQPLLPDVAQLKLIRSMQQQVARLTRVIDDAERTGAEAGITAAEVAELQDTVAGTAKDVIDAMQRQPGDVPGMPDLEPDAAPEGGGDEPG